MCKDSTICGCSTANPYSTKQIASEAGNVHTLAQLRNSAKSPILELSEVRANALKDIELEEEKEDIYNLTSNKVLSNLSIRHYLTKWLSLKLQDLKIVLRTQY